MATILASYDGVELRRVVDRSCAVVREHAHDWPVLSIFVMGRYRNRTDLGEVDIAAPSAVLYSAGAAHANQIGDQGFEQIEIEFDPAWAELADGLPLTPASLWVSGQTATASRALARLCQGRPDEAALRTGLQRFVEKARRHTQEHAPAWITTVEAMQRDRGHSSVTDLARRIGRHPAWLSAAYARCRGETLAEAKSRLKVEWAAQLLRETDQPSAVIALDAGFCDQSHMIRSFRRVLGRLPLAVRNDRLTLRPTGNAAETQAGTPTREPHSRG